MNDLSCTAPMQSTVDPFGVYVHFPWCLKKCPYCDFLSVATPKADIPHAAYADAILAELDRRYPNFEANPLRSVFFGGGTPSLWQAEQLGKVLSAILSRFQRDDGEGGVEVTVECNPSSLTYEHARALRDVGVNRLSIGVQSLNTQRLQFLGRLHTPDEGIEAVTAALKSGMGKVSADLIFGVAGQTAEDAAVEVRRIAELGPGHVSAYALTIEPGTQFGALHQRRALPLLDDAAVAESFRAVHEALSSFGYEHYEISNYARLGQRSVHNFGYWLGLPYLGLGAGAWGTLPDRTGGALRYRNTPAVERYVSAAKHWAQAKITEPCDLVAVIEPLIAETLLKERLMLGLRTRDGVDLGKAAQRFGLSTAVKQRRVAIARQIHAGNVIEEDSRLRIPLEKWLFSDAIIANLL